MKTQDRLKFLNRTEELKSIKTRTVAMKKIYKRKEKHKPNYDEDME